VGEIHRGLDLSQSALSQHLAVLREAGVVRTNRRSQTIFYDLNDGPALGVIRALYEGYCRPRARRSHGSATATRSPIEARARARATAPGARPAGARRGR